MAWRKETVDVGGSEISADLKTIGGVPTKLETSEPIARNTALEIGGARFRTGKPAKLDDRWHIPLLPVTKGKSAVPQTAGTAESGDAGSRNQKEKPDGKRGKG